MGGEKKKKKGNSLVLHTGARTLTTGESTRLETKRRRVRKKKRCKGKIRISSFRNWLKKGGAEGEEESLGEQSDR